MFCFLLILCADGVNNDGYFFASLDKTQCGRLDGSFNSGAYEDKFVGSDFTEKAVDARFLEWVNASFVENYLVIFSQQVNGQGEVALFVGDEAQYLWPAGLEAALKLLKAAGVEPVLVGVGRNNGYLASSMGFSETAKSLAQATLDDLKASGATR